MGLLSSISKGREHEYQGGSLASDPPKGNFSLDSKKGSYAPADFRPASRTLRYCHTSSNDSDSMYSRVQPVSAAISQRVTAHQSSRVTGAPHRRPR